jgi:hypothetical protein
MALYVEKIQGLEWLEIFLQGGILGTRKLDKAVYGLAGTTLKITVPAIKSVTFTTPGSSPMEGLLLSNIINQINDPVTGLHPGVVVARAYSHGLVLVEITPNLGVTLDKTGTANSVLGFDTSKNTVGTKYKAPGAGVPEIVTIIPTPDNSYLVVSDE